jgi:hypothetical protein
MGIASGDMGITSGDMVLEPGTASSKKIESFLRAGRMEIGQFCYSNWDCMR